MSTLYKLAIIATKGDMAQSFEPKKKNKTKQNKKKIKILKLKIIHSTSSHFYMTKL